MSDDAACTADGRLFHTHGAATENDRSPRVDCLTGGTIRVLWLHLQNYMKHPSLIKNIKCIQSFICFNLEFVLHLNFWNNVI